MWEDNLIGAGTALTPVWNGVPALYHGAMVNPVERNHALLVVSLRVFRGSSLMDSGAHEDMKTLPPVMPFFFDWDLDGSADHVGIVVGTDGSRVYTVEGNSGDACKIKKL